MTLTKSPPKDERFTPDVSVSTRPYINFLCQDCRVTTDIPLKDANDDLAMPDYRCPCCGTVERNVPHPEPDSDEWVTKIVFRVGFDD